MKKSVFVTSVISIIVLITSVIFTGCSGQKFTQDSNQQYAYSFARPTGWELHDYNDSEMNYGLGVLWYGDLKVEQFTDNSDNTFLKFETRIVNNYTQADQAVNYTNVPCLELTYADCIEGPDTSVKSMVAQEYIFTCSDSSNLPYPQGTKGIMIWFSSDKYKYVITYVAPSAKLFDEHYDLYQKVLDSFVAS